MKEASCKKSCDNEICNMTVYVRPWENYRELINFSCKKLAAIKPMGAMSQIDNNDVDALKALNFGIKSLNDKSNDIFLNQILRVDKVSKQVVAGWNYEFEFTMGRTNCTKNSSKSLSLCSVDTKSKTTDCKISVWDQPWLDDSRYKVTRSSC